MAKKEAPQSLFRRLTRLFRSGPVIKKKIRTVDTTMAVADKTKSSGTLLFQKSLAPTYATITANAYNLSERLMRYQDFQEMEYSLAIDTQIATPDGYVTIGELAEKCKADPNYTFVVYSYDHNKKQIVPALGKQARQTCVDHAWKITFDSGKSITASPEHRLMLRDGTYRKTEDIQVGDAMMPFYRKDLFEDAEEGTKGYSWIYTMNDKFRGWTKEHQLIAEWIAGRPLTEDECVHHINFVKSDNRPENLKIMTNSDHNSYHAAINNGVKWAPENHEWIEQFKKNHATWMRDNAPTRRHDVTFARILETAERVGFSLPAISSTLDVTWNLIFERLVSNGYANFEQFVDAYANGQITNLVNNRPGLLTRDLSINLIKSVITSEDTKRSLCIKLGCTVNVLDKFLNKRARTTWSELRSSCGYSDQTVVVEQIKSARAGGRPKGSNKGTLTLQQICDAYETGLTLPRLTEKLGVSKNTIISRLAQNGYQKYSEFSSQYENHKVVSIEYVGEIPLYDLTVDGYKNFATDSVISHNTPEIAAALDIYADETVAADEKGRCLHIYSDNEKVKEILEDLFYNTLNTEFNLRSWARNLVKYGDFFLYNDVSQHYGVVSAFPIPVNEIEREENYDRDDPFAVRYRWVTLGNRVLENWEVTHFRLLGNDMFLPYGSSVIEPARRIWRQLILIEDAMLVYRVVRAPERRVFYIDVANIPAADIPVYMEEQRKNLRSNQVVDRSSGRVDLRYNPLPVRQNTLVPLLDGRTITIKELANEFDMNKQNWVYSVQDETHKIVPGKVIWCGKNYTCDNIYRVWLDDKSYIDTAPEHPFVMRDGSSKRADELAVGDSLMPLNKKLSSINDGHDIDGYPIVYDHFSEKFQFVHRIVANEVLKIEKNIEQQKRINKGHHNLVVHHKDFNHLNANPENLQWMTNEDHWKYHASIGKENIVRYNRSPEKRARTVELNKKRNSVAAMASYNGSELHASHNEIRREAQNKSWITNKKQRSEKMQWMIPNEVVSFVFDQVKLNPKIGREELSEKIRLNSSVFESLKTANSSNKRDVSKFHVNAVISKLNRMGVINSTDFRGFRKYAIHNAAPINHQVLKVEILSDIDDVYCMTVVGPEGEHDRHNVAVQGQDGAQGIVFVKQSVDEDYFIPVRGTDSGTKIDTLAGGQNTAAVEDVAYIQKKLFAALKIPRAYLGYDEMLGSKATLAQEDIRFSRTISVIQKVMIAELNKLAIIHLYAHGFDQDDLQNFTLRLSNPSTIAQQQKLELWRTKFEIGGSAPEGYVNKDFVRKEIWGLNDEECKQIDKARLKDKIVDGTIESASAPEGDMGDAGGDDDLFGDAGGGDLGGDETEAPADDLPPEENAGEEPEEEVEPGTELLTSADRNDDDEHFGLKLSDKEMEVPLKAQRQLDRVLYNRGRHRTHGASKTHMPDFQKMTSNDNHAMEDPYDNDWIKSVVSNPFGESRTNYKTNITSDVMSMLNNWTKSKGGSGVQGNQLNNVLLSEDASSKINSNIDDDEDVLIIDDDGADDE